MKPIAFKDIYIPEPCQANWKKMQKNGPGRFCDNCSKNVYDLTKASEADFNKLVREKGKDICVRFYEDQISQNLAQKKETGIRKYRRHLVSFISVIILKLVTLSAGFSRELSADVPDTLIEMYANDQQKKISGGIYVVSGKVIDKTDDKGIYGITVRIFSGDQLLGTTTSAAEGLFSLTLEKEPASGTLLTIKTEEKKYKSWKYKTIYKSSEIIISDADLQNILLELKIKKKRRVHLKKRIIRTGRFRMNSE
jgi:hypothetical protein